MELLLRQESPGKVPRALILNKQGSALACGCPMYEERVPCACLPSIKRTSKSSQFVQINNRDKYHIKSSSYRTIYQQAFKMGDVMVENPVNQVLPHRKQMPSSIPNIDSLEGLGTDGSDEYSTLKKLQRHLE